MNPYKIDTEMNSKCKCIKKLKQWFLELHKEATGNSMKESVEIKFMTNLYLQTYKCKLSQIAVLCFAVFDVVLFLINNLTKDLSLFRIFSSLIALCAVSYFVCIGISYKFSIIMEKLIPPTMSLKDQKKYQCKQQIGVMLIVFVAFALSAVYFVGSIIYYQHVIDTLNSKLNTGVAELGKKVYSVATPILDNVGEDFLWKYLFALFIIVLLCTGLLLSFFLFHWDLHSLVSFRFSSDMTYSDCVSKNGIELLNADIRIKTFDLSKDKLYLENFGVLLVYTTDTKDFKTFTNTEFDSIVLRKNDGSILGKLLFANNRWEFI